VLGSLADFFSKMLFDQRLSPAGILRALSPVEAARAVFSTERCVELPFVVVFFLIIIFANLFGFFFLNKGILV